MYPIALCIIIASMSPAEIDVDLGNDAITILPSEGVVAFVSDSGDNLLFGSWNSMTNYVCMGEIMDYE